MDRQYRHPVVVAELLHRIDVGSHRIDADHDLHAVIAQPAGKFERARGALRIHRGGGEADPGGWDLDQLAFAFCTSSASRAVDGDE